MIRLITYLWGRPQSGGSWINNPRNCRSASRNNNQPGNRNNNIGFRVSCAPPALFNGQQWPGQNWQMGICRAYLRRVQTCSGDVCIRGRASGYPVQAEPVTERASKNKTGSASLVGKPKSWRILVWRQSLWGVYPGRAWAAGRQERRLECGSVCRDPYG